MALSKIWNLIKAKFGQKDSPESAKVVSCWRTYLLAGTLK